MGQCVSSQDDGREVRRGTERREETQSLMRHEEGYHDSECMDTGYRERPISTRSRSNGHRPPSETRTGDRELSDVASGDLYIGDITEREPASVVQPAFIRSVPIQSQKGKETMEELSKAYRWREQFEHPSSEFLALMDRLYMECQLHLTALSSQGDPDSRREADTIVNEMVALRNYWGPQLLPSSTCNAFVRERIPLTLGVDQTQFRIDCAQFFESVPFYGNQQSSCPGELMKLYRFSVYSVSSNEVVLRYYLERSNITQLYHVLCFMDDNCHGQVKPYGTECPSYWDVRQNMLADLNLRLLNTVFPGTHPVPEPLAQTLFPPGQSTD